jgi:hypothetical protein
MKVAFEGVGRGKLSWTADLASLSEAALVRELRRKKALASRGVDFEFNDDGTAAFILVGGFRRVGFVRLIDSAKVTVTL